MPERIDQLVRDLENQAKSISAIVLDQREMKDQIGDQSKALVGIDKLMAVRAERDKHIDERFDRIERSIGGVYKLGWWILTAFGAVAIALVANFAFRGGFIVS